MYRRLTNLQPESSQPTVRRTGLFGLFDRKVDLVDHYEKKLEGIEKDMRVQRAASFSREVCP